LLKGKMDVDFLRGLKSYDFERIYAIG
jgi:hypothetical protein